MSRKISLRIQIKEAWEVETHFHQARSFSQIRLINDLNWWVWNLLRLTASEAISRALYANWDEELIFSSLCWSEFDWPIVIFFSLIGEKTFCESKLNFHLTPRISFPFQIFVDDEWTFSESWEVKRKLKWKSELLVSALRVQFEQLSDLKEAKQRWQSATQLTQTRVSFKPQKCVSTSERILSTRKRENARVNCITHNYCKSIGISGARVKRNLSHILSRERNCVETLL